MRNLYILLLGMFLSGCGLEVEDSGQPVRTTSSIVIQNNAFATVNGFYISDGSGYGANQIEGKFITTGQSYEISGIACGKTYTMKIVRISAEDIIQKDLLVKCDEDYVWHVNG